EPVLTLPEAIRKMTSWPATRMRLAGRGSLREGNWADVTVFDLATIQDKATYEQPMQSPAGIEYVIVNGQLVVDHGKHTGAKPGTEVALTVLPSPPRGTAGRSNAAASGCRNLAWWTLPQAHCAGAGPAIFSSSVTASSSAKSAVESRASAAAGPKSGSGRVTTSIRTSCPGRDPASGAASPSHRSTTRRRSARHH